MRRWILLEAIHANAHVNGTLPGSACTLAAVHTGVRLCEETIHFTPEPLLEGSDSADWKACITCKTLKPWLRRWIALSVMFDCLE
jgi:hypothetical protein